MFRIIYCFIVVSLLYSPLYAVDFWQATKLYGGYTQPIAFAPNGDIYIGTHRGGIFSSSDDGRTWRTVNHKTFFFQQLAFDKEGRLWGARWATPGLVYSDDNGKTWAGKLDTAFSSNSSLLILSDNTMLIAQDAKGILRSTDRGATWEIRKKFGLWEGYIFSLAFDSADSSVYTGIATIGLYRSQDKGRTWAEYMLNYKLDYTRVASLPQYIVTISDSSVYLISKSDKTLKQIFRGSIEFSGLATISDSTIIAGDRDGQVIVSHDLGKTWKQHYLSFVRDIKVTPAGSILITSGDGIWRSDNQGETWEATNIGILGQITQTVFFANNDLLFASNIMGKFFRSANQGETWKEITLGDLSHSIYPHSVYCMAQTSDGTLYAGTNNAENPPVGSGMYLSHDEGLTWQAFNIGLKDNVIRGIGITKTGNVYAGTGTYGLFKQRTDKSGWEPTTLSAIDVWSVLIDSNDNIFVGATAGGIYRSKDGGISWSFVQLPTAGDIQSMAQAPDGTLYAVSFDGPVYYSEDHGDNWQNIEMNNDGILRAVAVDKQGQVYIAGKRSFIRKHKSSNWEDITGDIATHELLNTFYCLAIAPNGTPWMGTTRGLFKGNLTTLAVPSIEAISSQLTVYPNPIKTIATIEFTLVTPANVELTIFNSLGEQITTIIKQTMIPGTYTIPWIASNISSGSYYCRLTYGSYVETRTLTVLK